MSKKVGEQTIIFENKPRVKGFFTTAGKKEGDGNFGDYFDKILDNDKLCEKTFEHAERKILKSTVENAIKKSKEKVELLISGDLLNQIVVSSFTARELEMMFLGVYGACSTMAESLIVGSIIIDGNFLNAVACATGSHFSTAERQYRYPLELGNQRPPTSQWTVTGAGCAILGNGKKGIYIASATIGKVVDFGVSDVNNMGGIMAPSAVSSFKAHFLDTKTTPNDYDLILTGDLGKFGSEVFIDMMEREGFKLGKNYCDCGHMMFNNNQRTFQGGSGAGCSALVLNSYVFKNMLSGKYKRVLFGATGALLSTTTAQQGDTTPGICNIVEFRLEE